MTSALDSTNKKGGTIMSWYKFSLTENEIENGNDKKATEEFIKSYSIVVSRIGVPKSLALFSGRNRADKNLSYFIHIPPELENTLKPYLLLFSAVSCDKPQVDSVGLLFGVQDDKDLLR